MRQGSDKDYSDAEYRAELERWFTHHPSPGDRRGHRVPAHAREYTIRGPWARPAVAEEGDGER